LEILTSEKSALFGLQAVIDITASDAAADDATHSRNPLSDILGLKDFTTDLLIHKVYDALFTSY
jgi:hypothetical protein